MMKIAMLLLAITIPWHAYARGGGGGAHSGGTHSYHVSTGHYHYDPFNPRSY